MPASNIKLPALASNTSHVAKRQPPVAAAAVAAATAAPLKKPQQQQQHKEAVAPAGVRKSKSMAAHARALSSHIAATQASDPDPDHSSLPPEVDRPAVIQFRPLSELELTALFRWIDGIPLSRPKKNFTRDFSDACLCAEVVRAFYPKLVDLHNYPPANSVAQKVYNWNTLNFKVLRRLGIALSEESVHAIASCTQGQVEVLLSALKEKLAENGATVDIQPPSLPAPPASNAQQRAKPSVASEQQQANRSSASRLPVVKPAAPKQAPKAAPRRDDKAVHPAAPAPAAAIASKPAPYGDATTIQMYAQPSTQAQLTMVNPVQYAQPQLRMAQPPPNAPLAAYSQPYPPPQAVPQAIMMPAHPAVDSAAKDDIILGLKDTIAILQEKVEKLETLVSLKDRRLEELTMRLNGDDAVMSKQHRPALS
ncbi:hypothetical protein RI367_004427 [Sorochytrium milnesiophthora]